MNMVKLEQRMAMQGVSKLFLLWPGDTLADRRLGRLLSVFSGGDE